MPFIPDITEKKFVSKNVEISYQAFLHSEKDQVSLIPGEFPSMSSNPTVTDALIYVHSVVPSVSPSTVP